MPNRLFFAVFGGLLGFGQLLSKKKNAERGFCSGEDLRILDNPKKIITFFICPFVK